MELRHVDPSRRRGRALEAWHAIARSRAGRWYGINVASRFDARVLRLTGGRIRLVGPLPTAVLSTTGAKSGLPRENPVVYFHDGTDVVLIASSFGRDRHPAWFHNLLAHPEVRLNGHRFRAAEVTDASEYERLFALAVRLYPGYADYRDRTALVGRRIPVLRLVPA
ncbi:nitroreductase family deazaflavin-dependent oxidoreductase [Nocardioides sp.]|uniref:nitroreductase family deazaflavin-dependent oxidoreductase n=1 Tax=Nocardioides sp. TaxID=35761 RepID=UPI003D12B6FC